MIRLHDNNAVINSTRDDYSQIYIVRIMK